MRHREVVGGTSDPALNVKMSFISLRSHTLVRVRVGVRVAVGVGVRVGVGVGVASSA